jgi:hypothetical protein
VRATVDLFGKKKFEDRIRELELQIDLLTKERIDLVSNLDKREEKIRKLTGALQEANISLKAAEKRSSGQPTEVVKVEQREESNKKAKWQRLKPYDAEKLLRRLQAIRSPQDDLLTAYIRNPVNLPPDIETVAMSVKSNRGMAVLYCPWIFSLVLVPPFPITESIPERGPSFQLDQLFGLLDIPVLVVSAHAGDSFIGLALTRNEFDMKEIIESPVKEKHSKGGWSQKRFERLREEDIRNHANAIIERLQKIGKEYRAIAKYAIIGGDPTLIKTIRPSIELESFERNLERHDAKRLDKLLDDVYSFRYYRS